MREKIEQNLAAGRYIGRRTDVSTEAYISRHGWTDYLIANRILVSHRQNNYADGTFPDYLHVHDYCEVVVYVSGDMQYIADEQYLAATSGAVILTKPLSVHMIRLLRSSFCDRYVFYFRRDIGLAFSADGVLDFLDAPGKNANYMCFSGEERAELFTRLGELDHALTSCERGSEALAFARLLDLFVLFSRNAGEQAPNLAKLQAPAPQAVYEIKRYIDEHCVELHSVAELAATFFYSREYISRVFKLYFNTPVYEYIISRKLLLSRSYISAGMKIEDAAFRSGFCNMSSFIKQFKRVIGMTPSAYRDQQAAQSSLSHENSTTASSLPGSGQ